MKGHTQLHNTHEHEFKKEAVEEEMRDDNGFLGLCWEEI